MRETAGDLERLQRLLDDSAERASGFLRSSFEIPERSLSAEQRPPDSRGADGGARDRHRSRRAARGADQCVLLRAAFYVPTVAESARARHLARRPAASLTYFEGTTLAVIAHGEIEIIAAEDPAFEELDEMQVALGGQSPLEWQGRGVYLHLEARVIHTYAA